MQAAVTEEISQERLTLFDDRYGVGAYDRLLALLAQPCSSFADIAGQFGVTRERVRQWHLQFMPDAPRGRERRRLCVLQNARKRLLADPLFRLFYQHARSRFEPQQVSLIRSHAGFRSRAVRLNGHLVGVRKARLITRSHGSASRAHVLTPCRRAMAFVYYLLDDGEFLFVPRAELPETGTTFLDSPGSKYQRYRNTFAAAEGRRGPGTTATDHSHVSTLVGASRAI